MVEEAQANKEKDQERRMQIDNMNKLESLIYQTEKTMDEHADKMEDGDLDEIKSEIERAKELLGSEQHEEVAAMLEDFEKKMQEAVGKMYQKAMQEAAQNAPPDPGPGNDDIVSEEDVVDADFEDS